jgi:hypothetical protein
MSNTKEVHITAEVPYHWLGYGESTPSLTDEERAFIALMFVTPGTGLQLRYGGEHGVPNDRGGITATFRLIIEGVEAVRHATLVYLVDILRKVGTVDQAEVMDLEYDRTNPVWETIA